MDAEHKDEESIFKAALKITSSTERLAYLKKACGNDAKLLDRVEALLKAYEEAGNFLESPPGVDITLDESPISESPGTVIDRYKLLERIGEGGMAVVYMAEQQEPIHRKVALKVIKLGMDTKEVIARFEVERQALAMMDHPNIAKVLDAGTTDTGRPYFVMELVHGISITEYCDKNNLDNKERLELFMQVCHAVQHAHQKGIIHRDIKPSNVMVTLHDGKPVPMVIDFGIAKATSQRLTEKTLFTRYAHMIGTPEYMSPEQAEMSCLDIDTRTDIYSLGVLLYELLTGSPPFTAEELRSKGYAEMQRMIREKEPTKPSTKLSTLGDDLIEVARHHKTNPELLPKLVRGDLDWIVMKALEKDRTRRYEAVGGFADDIMRHLNNEVVKAVAPSLLYKSLKFVRRNRTVVVSGFLIVAALFIGLALAMVGFIRASYQRDVAETQRQRAEVNFQKAREAVDRMLTQVAEELPRLPGMSERLDSPQVTQIKQALLERALEYYEGFLEERSSDPLVRYETAHAYLRVGDITKLTHLYKRAEETYITAAILLEELAAEFPDELNYHMDLAHSYSGQARLLMGTGRLKEAEHVYRKALFSYGNAIELDSNHSHHWYMRGGTYLEMKQWDKAVSDYTVAIELDPNQWLSWRERGFAYMQLEQWNKALSDYSTTIKLKPDNGGNYVRRADAYAHLGQYEHALSDCTKAIELYPDHSHYWNWRGAIYLGMKEWDKTVADYTKAIELDPNQWLYWHERGFAYMQLEQWDKVVSDYSTAIMLQPDSDGNYYRRAIAYTHLGQYEHAIADYTKAIELNLNDSYLAYIYALLQMYTGDIEGYRNTCNKMYERFSDSEKQADIYWFVWTCVLGLNAVGDLNKIVKLAENLVESDNKNDQYLNALGSILYRAGRFEETVEKLTRLDNTWEETGQYPTQTSPAYTWYFLAMAHHQLGNDEAKSWFDKAVEQAERELAESPAFDREITLKLLEAEAESLLSIK